MSEIEKLAYRPDEAAEAIGCSRAKVYQMMNSGELPYVTIGSLRRIPVDQLRELIASRASEQKAS